MNVRCATCGESHDLAEISLGADAPAQWEMISEAELANSELTRDQCIIRSADGATHLFVRGCLEVPIRGTTRSFSWGVWVSLSEASFSEMSEHWDDPLRTSLGPYFGWLCTPLPSYPDTMFLRTHVHQRDVGVRPLVEVEPTSHPLAIDQRDGIDQTRLQDLVHAVLHG